MKVHHIPCGPPVNESEHKAFEHLKNGLRNQLGSEEWILLTNVNFSVSNKFQVDEIDVVAIGPPGVQIIEVKHWSESWVKGNPVEVKHEALRLTEKARRMGTKLKRRVENLPFVEGVFLVTQSRSKVAGLETHGPINGIRFCTLKGWEDALAFNARPVLSRQQIRDLARLVEPQAGKMISGKIGRFAGYIGLILQSKPDEKFHRTYKARHAQRQDRVVLHLYDLSATDDTKALQKAEREWKALRHLDRYDWTPRIVDSFQPVSGYPGEIMFYSVADPAAPTVKERSKDREWSSESRLDFVRKSIAALTQLHAAGTEEEPILHRNLTPETILVQHDNLPIFIGFEHTKIPTAITVAGPVSDDDTNSTVSPEVRQQGLGVADSRSDIYSLCASLLTLFDDQSDQLSKDAVEVLELGTCENSTERSNLVDLDNFIGNLLGELPPHIVPGSIYWSEGQIVSFRDNDYRIESRLGSGGIGTVFKVEKVDQETGRDLGTYVGKVVHDEAVGEQVRRSYELAHSHLHHPALSTIFEIALSWADNSFVSLMTWVKGAELIEYEGVLPVLSEQLGYESCELLAIEWLETVCSALQKLHDGRLIHGDVSPRNLIVSDRSLCLTDYDCVSTIGKQRRSPGTVLYCAPPFQEAVGEPSDDIYALAASFFQVLFGREPFLGTSVEAKGKGLNWHDGDKEEYPKLMEFFSRATDPVRENRFETISDAVSVIKGESRKPPAERLPNEVEWLRSLLQSYPGSSHGNKETHGLDTDFAKRTYVETRLFSPLLSDMKGRRVSLIVLCGNAGDGKTALLQRLGKELGLAVGPSKTRIVEGNTSDGMMVRMNLDGSGSWKGRSADDLLDEFLAPFHDGKPEQDIIHLLAINDGRLLEWIENNDQGSELTSALKTYLEGNEADAPHIRFINLNQRSLVGGISNDEKYIDSSFLNSLIDQLYGGDEAAKIWAPCRNCSSQESCDVFRAQKVFGPGSLAEELTRTRARKRLFDALQAVHMRGETHITIRELRGTLVYILFGLHYCTEYHETPCEDDNNAMTAYWDRAFSAFSPRRQGNVLSELPRFDPAIEANPKVDRNLRFMNKEVEVANVHLLVDEQKIDSTRRWAYFNLTEDDILRIAGNADALGLTNGHHLQAFRKLAFAGEKHKQEITKKLCAGISRLEVLPPQALDRPEQVPLKISQRTPTETAFWVEKPLSRFSVAAVIPTSASREDCLHNTALLTYERNSHQKETLRISADLFHLLMELSEGYQLGDAAADDTFAHLSIFIQRLVQEDHREMLAWNPMNEATIYRIRARIDNEENAVSQKIVIEQVIADNGLANEK